MKDFDIFMIVRKLFLVLIINFNMFLTSFKSFSARRFMEYGLHNKLDDFLKKVGGIGREGSILGMISMLWGQGKNSKL